MLGWFIWPFLFIYSLAHGLKDYLQGGENPPTGNLALASFCLMLMMCVVMVGMILCQEKVQIKNDFFPSCQHT